MTGKTLPKAPTSYTINANAEFAATLPFNDKADFLQARKGHIYSEDVVTITDADDNVVWDLEKYKKYIGLDKPCPDSVNPSLWRNAQLCMIDGLFEVTDGIYQVRNYDLSNITFVRGKTGWIVIDCLISPECSKAALDLVNAHVEELEVVAIIYSHSHIDHFGGAKGLLTEKQLQDGSVEVYASQDFTEHAVSENVIAGNAMARRSIFMYGAFLPRNVRGSVNGGLGQTTSTGEATLLLPTHTISKTGERFIDGIRMFFQFTPGTEAPTEMNTYFPDKKALWMAENTTCTMHNILTLRGALVRDALMWAKYLTETIDLWGKSATVKFQSHHWPLWENAKILDYLEKQRDTYRFIHDQSVRYMNKGFIGSEIAEKLRLPESLHTNWPSRGYYGTLKHNSRAVYQRYMGWYSGNPSDLDSLQQEDAAKKYIEYMGGKEAVADKAQKDFNNGQYRWVAEVCKHLVFAHQHYTRGKEILADAYEQLGYQAESGPWRSVYLQGAYELRNDSVPGGDFSTTSPDIIANMSPSMLFDYLAIHMNAEMANGYAKFTLSITFTDADIDATFTLTVQNCVLSYTENSTDMADAGATLSKQVLIDLAQGNMTVAEAVASGQLLLAGDTKYFKTLISLMDQDFNPMFPIVTP